MQTKFFQLVALCLIPGCLLAAEPRVIAPFDGSPALFDGSGKPIGIAALAGAGPVSYTGGVDGKALEVRRLAYDQVTAVNFNKLPELDGREGTVSFFFRPNWEMNDGESRRLFEAGRFGSPFYLYFIKTKSGHLELSVCTPQQHQVLAKASLKRKKWVHLAFSWSIPNGEVAIYVDGKLAGHRALEAWKERAYSSKAPWNAWLGTGGGDRFKAKVAEGAYDNLKIYDTRLSDAEVLADFLGGNKKAMNEVPLSGIQQANGKIELRFHGRIKRLPSSAPLLALKSGKTLVTVSSMGTSGKLVLSGGGKQLESPYVFNLTRPLKIGFRPEGSRMEIWFDDAFQGMLEIPGGWGGLESVRTVEEVTIVSAEPGESELAPLKRKAQTALEKQLWSLDDAEYIRQSVRETVSLNGLWRIYEDDSCSYAPVLPKEQHYSRVPGSRRSSYFKHYREKNGKLEGFVVPGGPRTTADWYQRTFTVPEAWKGKRIFLNFDNLAADYGRVYLNGKLIDSFQQEFKHFAAVPNARRIDVTSLLEKENVLSIFVERPIRMFWRDWPGLQDSWAVTVWDVRLESAPSPVFVKSTVALPSFRNKTLELRTTVANPQRVKGEALLSFRFERADDEKVFTKKFRLTGAPEQRIVFKDSWNNPVLWDASSPNLYTQRVTLTVNGKTADALPDRKFGFREAWVENGEFRLNGKKVRYRMLTSPGFEGWQMYFANPRAIAQYVASIKNINYDTVRFNPSVMQHRTVMPYYTPAYLEECDRQGLYNFYPMPFFENEDRTVYQEGVERFLEYYGSHPNILMWYTCFNGCGYAAGQDPYYLNNTEYDPPLERTKRERRLAAYAEKVMRSLDPSRECFPHAGGNMGKIFGSMNYQSFGTPLQEQEDWPKIWSANHSQPLMTVESGFPYPPQFFYFDGPEGYNMTAEHAARFFGDAVYRNEKSPAQFTNPLRKAPYAPRSENYFLASGEMYRRVVRAWRAYDVSALGDFTYLAEAYRIWGPGRHQSMIWGIDNDIKSAGMRPDNVRARALAPDYMHLEEIGALMKHEFAPLRVFIGGKAADFTNKDHAFFSKEEFEKSAVVVNDRMTKQNLRLCWKFVAGGEVVDRGEIEASAEPGAILKLPFRFTAPEVAERTEGKILLDVFVDGKAYDTDRFDVQIFPRYAKPDYTYAEPAGLYDPAGKTEALLKKAGFPYRRIATAEEAEAYRLIIIGQEALGEKRVDFLRKMEERSGFRLGRKVLIFEQQPCNLGNLVFESPSAREAFIRRAASPYVQGLKDADFRNWRGSSDTRPAKVVSDPNTTYHYPRAKWKIGNGGMVAGNVIRKPSFGAFKTIVDCGFNLMFSALMEYKCERAYLLFCQLDVTSRYGADPVATRLVDNMLSELAKPFLPVSEQTVMYYGDADGEALLKQFGLEYRKGENPAGFREQGAVIIGRNPVPEKDREAFRRNLAEYLSGNPYCQGTVICLPGAPLDLLPVPLRWEKKRAFRLEIPSGDPMFSGMTEADFYFRTMREWNVVSSPDKLVATSPAVFARYDFQAGGAVIVLGAAPDQLEEGFWNREKMTRAWSTLFANLNLPFKKNLTFFNHLRLRHNTVIPKLDGIELVDGSLKLDWKNDGKLTDTEGFKPYKLGTAWEKQGFMQRNPHYQYPANAPANLKKPYDGWAWIRVKVTVPADWKKHKIRLIGGPVDDEDITYFNGVKIGETNSRNSKNPYSAIREYAVPSELIRFGGENTITIHVFDRWGDGGATGPLRLVTEDQQDRVEATPYIEKLNFYDVDAFHNW